MTTEYNEYLEKALHQPCCVQVYDILDSTNRVARQLDASDVAEKPYLIIANEQTNGRGRLGRKFWSPPSAGLYMTLAFRPDFDLQRLMLITPYAALAVCRAIETVTGLEPKIKWVNDIYLNEKKICGIMTEAQTNPINGSIGKILLGIGVNCFDADMPDDLKEIAAHIENPLHEFTKEELAAEIVNQFFECMQEPDTSKIIDEYKNRSFLLGEQITIYKQIAGQSPDRNTSGGIKAYAIDIDINGGLVVKYLEGPHSGEIETITSGEVSVRKW